MIEQFGPPELLQVRDLPTPTPGEGEVAVGLLATLRPGGILVTLKGRNSRLESAAADRGASGRFDCPAPLDSAEPCRLVADGLDQAPPVLDRPPAHFVEPLVRITH